MKKNLGENMDAVDELIEHRKQTGTLSPMLSRVHRFHQTNPQVLDFLVSEMRVDRANGWNRTSLGSLWHYGRWVLTRKHFAPGESFLMSNNLFPYYGRIIAVLHAELNGFFRMAISQADADFGTNLEPPAQTQKPGYIRKLVWVDGKPLEHGWRPTTPHEPKRVARRERVKRAA
jgi:hypothetical protein